jgi:RNA polymerase sigma-70 factor (ECF subfamily)
VRRAILNAYLDGHRRRRLWAGVRHLVARAESDPGHEGASDDRTDVEVALGRLAPRLRAAVVLRFYDDLTVPEIARRLGVSDGAVKRYLHDGVAALEQLLGPVRAVPDHEIDLTPSGRL